MGLIDNVFQIFKKQEIEDNTFTKNEVKIKTIEVGSSGTEIYGGYIDDDYLAELNGTEWMDTIDKMRRSDANIRMALSAIKSPLKSANWYIRTTEKSEEAERQKALIEFCLFESQDKGFTKLLNEILTCIDYGFSLFDITHEIKDFNGVPITGIKSIAFRSQKTIERWNVKPDGTLVSVTQQADGDIGGNYELDPTFLIHFAPDMEGDNFAGFSILRPMYGSWLRKNRFLQLMAAGIEKYSISTPVMYVPEGSEGKPEYKNAEKALRCYTSNQANYMILPKGYELEFNNVTYDPQKIRETINFENTEMVNSILASFLLLGQNGSGSLALSGTLSDFYQQTITYITDHVIEELTRKIIKPLIRMNLGTTDYKVELFCDALEDKADTNYMTMIAGLKSAGLINSDLEIEKHLRQKLKLPEVQEQESIAPELAEKKKPSKQEIPKIIRSTQKALEIGADYYLNQFAQKYKNSVMRAYGFASDAMKVNAPQMASVPSLKDYQAFFEAVAYAAKLEVLDILEPSFTLSEIKLSAMDFKKVEKEIDGLLKAIELMNEKKSDLTQLEIEKINSAIDKSLKVTGEYLSAEQKRKVKAKTKTFIDTQMNDIVKKIDLTYSSNFEALDERALTKELEIAASDWIESAQAKTGLSIQSTDLINDGILESAAEYEKETGDSVISYTFVAVDDDVTTDLCSELNEITLSADDPKVDEFRPPLHWNCRSYWMPNTKLTGSPEIDEFPKLSKKAQEQLVLSEKK